MAPPAHLAACAKPATKQTATADTLTAIDTPSQNPTSMLWALSIFALVLAVSGSECAGTLTTTQASQAWDCRMPRSPTKVKRLFQSHGINSLTSSRGLRGDKDRVLPLRCNDAAEGDLRESHQNITTRMSWIVTDSYGLFLSFFNVFSE